MLNVGFWIERGGNVETPNYGVSAIGHLTFVGWVLDIQSPPRVVCIWSLIFGLSFLPRIFVNFILVFYITI